MDVIERSLEDLAYYYENAQVYNIDDFCSDKRKVVEDKERFNSAFIQARLWLSLLEEYWVPSATIPLLSLSYFELSKQEAIDCGIEGILEAYYAGVPYDDIVA